MISEQKNRIPGTGLSMLLLVTLGSAGPLQAQSAPSADGALGNTYSDTVTDLIANEAGISGPYDPALIEFLSERGRRFQESGNHHAALLSFKHMLHVTRVNHGLYAESQLGIIEQMIKSQSALNDWTGIDHHYSLLQHLYVRIYDTSDERLANGLQHIASWYRFAANANLNGDRLDHLIRLNSLLKISLRIAESNSTADSARLESLNRSIALNERELYRSTRPRENSDRQRQGGRRERR